MAETFACPACGAPVSVLGGDSSMRCPYCHQVIAVPPQFRSHQLNAEVIRAVLDELRAGRRIQAIKLLRQVTGLGLKDANDLLTRAEAELERYGEAHAADFLLREGSLPPAASTQAQDRSHMRSTLLWTFGAIAFVLLVLLALVFLAIRLA